MKYVLLFVDTEEFARDLESMGPAERDQTYQRVVEWMATHAGQIRGEQAAAAGGGDDRAVRSR